jgi:DNA (cytosine-5)-methyltransferase 1
MENVKGILSSTHGGAPIFDRILEDLSQPGGSSEYDIRSFVVPGSDSADDHQNFIIRSERYGVPQTRHRVILFGVRKDLVKQEHGVLTSATSEPVTVGMTLAGLPPLRSRLSKEPDSHDAWLNALRTASKGLKGWRSPHRTEIELRMNVAWRNAIDHQNTGAEFIPSTSTNDSRLPANLQQWFHDSKLGGVIQHSARSHMRSDLHRYLTFCIVPANPP